MNKNLAFQTTWEDVKNVMTQNGKHVTILEAELIFENKIAGKLDRIEQVALQGNNLDEQTNYANEEIATILQEENLL